MSKKGFTLVELLVVIGIIALLISILLPALNKARQQANLISCGSRLHQMGLVLSIYETEYKGCIPYGQIDNRPSPVLRPINGVNENYWYWMFALGVEIDRNLLSSSDGAIHNLSKIFTDLDTADYVPTLNQYGNNWVSHYMCNPAIFYYPSNYNFGTSTQPLGMFKEPLYEPRKIGDVRTPSTFAIWDAPQDIERGFNSYPVASNIDMFGFSSTGLAFSTAYNGDMDTGLPIWPSGKGGTLPGYGNGAALQKSDNFDGAVDFPDVPDSVCLRFRHSNNTKLSALCIDGHVETRLVGSVTRKDIYSNVP